MAYRGAVTTRFNNLSWLAFAALMACDVPGLVGSSDCAPGFLYDAENNRCVDCLPTCSGNTPRCDQSRHQCVECLAHSDCPEANAQCLNDVCAPCENDSHCAHIADKPLCVDGSCGACRFSADVSEEQAFCPDGFCNADPASEDYLTCQPSPAERLPYCSPCVSNHQCDGRMCVPVFYKGVFEMNACLGADELCSGVPIPTSIARLTLSDPHAEKAPTMCAHDEEKMSCSAWLKAGDTCAETDDCGGAPGFCQSGRCKYPCHNDACGLVPFACVANTCDPVR